jgi:capsule biosynthesis phosphatase
MIILIPIGGTGERFSKEGYKNPKPLINVLGKPMINWVIDSFKLAPEDQIVIAYREELNNFNFMEYLKNEYPKVNINFVELKFNTRGAVETVLCALNNIHGDLDQPVMISDCDTFYEEDVVNIYKNDLGNRIFYFKATEEKPIYSYIQLNKTNHVTEIKEKVKISDNANSGIYCFQSGKTLKSYCEEVINASILDKGEFYVSNIFKLMLAREELVKGIEVKKFHCLGTPFQLQLFATSHVEKGEKTRFCFDFDNTLVSFPKVKNDYSTVEPIETMVNFARFLKKQGHTIIIHTARRMKTHKGNIGSVIADVGQVTLETIKKFDIPCDELYFGKPYADFYIDDKAVNVFQDPYKEIGYYPNEIQSRSFNTVFEKDGKIIKTSNSPNFEGELHWYRNIPKRVEDFFPCAEIKGKNLIMDKILGVNLSCLFVNNSLTSGHLTNLLSKLHQIHWSEKAPANLQVYSNYATKISSRYDPTKFKFPDYHETFVKIINDLDLYQKEDMAIPGVIHGDPVFTNIFLENKYYTFIDMKGKLGNTNSIFGDILYDYAKVYQSLLGYDFILQGKSINRQYTNDLIEAFKQYLKSYCPNISFKNVRMITRSHLFSLLPLHTDMDKCSKYYDLIKEA